jgi:hypothetical protein
MHCRFVQSRWISFFVLTAAAAAQDLTVASAPDHVQQFKASDIAKMPHTMITATEHGKPRQFEGVWLRDVLKQAGVPIGTFLRGQNMPAYLYFTAKDGYHVTLALAEVDPSFQDNQILIADASDGKPLPAEDGPLRLIVPEDKKPARWIRMLERIDLKMPEASRP